MKCKCLHTHARLTCQTLFIWPKVLHQYFMQRKELLNVLTLPKIQDGTNNCKFVIKSIQEVSPNLATQNMHAGFCPAGQWSNRSGDNENTKYKAWIQRQDQIAYHPNNVSRGIAGVNGMQLLRHSRHRVFWESLSETIDHKSKSNLVTMSNVCSAYKCLISG